MTEWRAGNHQNFCDMFKGPINLFVPCQFLADVMRFVNDQECTMPRAALTMPFDVSCQTLIGDDEALIVCLIAVICAPAAIEIKTQLSACSAPLLTDLVVMRADNDTLNELIFYQPFCCSKTGNCFS